MAWLKEIAVTEPPFTTNLPVCHVELSEYQLKGVTKGSHITWVQTFTLNVDGVDYKKDIVLDLEVV